MPRKCAFREPSRGCRAGIAFVPPRRASRLQADAFLGAPTPFVPLNEIYYILCPIACSIQSIVAAKLFRKRYLMHIFTPRKRPTKQAHAGASPNH